MLSQEGAKRYARPRYSAAANVQKILLPVLSQKGQCRHPGRVGYARKRPLLLHVVLPWSDDIVWVKHLF